MKCIYCNNESDLSVSDIIPAALTGAKLRKRFVCRYHNGFTNDHYEKKMIAKLDIYRNQIGLTERNGGPVRYKARVEVDGYVVEEKTVSDIASIVNPKNPFRTKDESGHTVLIGETEQLLRIKGATVDKIQTINMGRILQTDDRYVFTKEMKTKVVSRYMNLDQKGEFAAMLDDAITFFESVCH